MYNYKKDCINEDVLMKPRIFISSTFYDLKYIREDLANFVRAHDYEPVLFEDGDIGYTPGKELDKSCYESMKSCDMVILIVGGEYGSAATGEKKNDFEEYISITRKEFRAAVDSGIPVYAMIDKNVSTEYGIYEENYTEIEIERKNIKFKTTKNINVFRFIKEIKGIVEIPVQEFTKASEIKEFIAKQWSDMFKNYLVSLRKKKEAEDIGATISDLNTIVSEMKVMLNAIGQKVIAEDKTVRMEQVLTEQSRVKMEKFANSLARYITCTPMEEMTSDEAVKRLLNGLENTKKRLNNEENIDINSMDILFEQLLDQDLRMDIAAGMIIGLIMKEDFEESASRSQIEKLLLNKELFNNLFNNFNADRNEKKVVKSKVSRNQKVKD